MTGEDIELCRKVSDKDRLRFSCFLFLDFHGVQDRRNHILTHMSYLITQLQGKDVELVFRKDEDHYFFEKKTVWKHL